MRRLVMSLALVLALVPGLFLASPGLTRAQSDDPQCSDFDSYFDAWEAFEEAGGPEEDPYDFDPDGNGWPCEELPDTPAEAADAPDDAWPREAQDDEPAEEASEEPIDETPAATEEASDDAAEASDDADATGGMMAEDGMPVTGVGPISGDNGTIITALALAAMLATALAGFSLMRTRRI